jgi:hypothetical protein
LRVVRDDVGGRTMRERVNAMFTSGLFRHFRQGVL